MSILARLERMERDKPKPGPLAAFSDDELTVQLLEACAECVASDLSAEDRAEATATAERIRSDLEIWAAFWSAGGWNGEPPGADRLRRLIGNGISETARDRARHGEMRHRANAALAATRQEQPQ